MLPARIPGQSRRGPQPNFSTAKAAMCVLGMTGESAFLEDAYISLKRDQDLRIAFETSTGSGQQPENDEARFGRA